MKRILFVLVTVALLGTTAMAQPANAPPSNLSNSARSAPDYDDEDASPAPRPSDRGTPDGPPPQDNRQGTAAGAESAAPK